MQNQFFRSNWDPRSRTWAVVTYHGEIVGCCDNGTKAEMFAAILNAACDSAETLADARIMHSERVCCHHGDAIICKHPAPWLQPAAAP